MQVPVWQDSHVTPPRSTTRSTGSPDGALENLALGDGSLGSHGSSPPQVGSHGTPASFAPPPPGPGREGSLLSADVLQRMHALEPPIFMANPLIDPKVVQIPLLYHKKLFRLR